MRVVGKSCFALGDFSTTLILSKFPPTIPLSSCTHFALLFPLALLFLILIYTWVSLSLYTHFIQLRSKDLTFSLHLPYPLSLHRLPFLILSLCLVFFSILPFYTLTHYSLPLPSSSFTPLLFLFLFLLFLIMFVIVCYIGYI